MPKTLTVQYQFCGWYWEVESPLTVEYQFCAWYEEVESKSSHHLAPRTPSVSLQVHHTPFSLLHSLHMALRSPPSPGTIIITIHHHHNHHRGKSITAARNHVQVVSSCVGWRISPLCVSGFGLEGEIWGLCICPPNNTLH